MTEEYFEVRYNKSKGEFSIFANGVSSKTVDAEQVSDELWEWLKVDHDAQGVRRKSNDCRVKNPKHDD